MAQPGYLSSSTEMVTIGGLTFSAKYARAILMPLPPDSHFQLPPRLNKLSKLPPTVRFPPWPSHIALFLALILQYLIERNKKVNGHLFSCYNLLATTGETITTYLHKGFELFSPEDRAKVFNMPLVALPKDDSSPFGSVWNLFAKTWRFILENDPIAPWRDNMVKNTLTQRGDFEIRFYLFHVCAVEYFTTIALARKTLTDGVDVDMPFGEQEYAAWCSLMAAALFLFKGKNLEQMDILEGTLPSLYQAVPGTESDVNTAINRLLQEEFKQRYTLEHYSHRQVLEMYDNAYSSLAERVTQVYRVLIPPAS